MKSKKQFLRQLLCSILFVSIPSIILPQELKSAFVKKSETSHVTVQKTTEGGWELLVNDEPFFIHGVVYAPGKIGESPDNSTLNNWMSYDDDNDGINDPALQSWVDENKNNVRDANEMAEGDFSILQKMGCNAIRMHHVPSDNEILGNIYRINSSVQRQFDAPIDKELLRTMYNDYGIMAVMGHFMGAFTIGTGTLWEEGTDYTNPKHRENIKKSVQAMVYDNKDEPYVLMWLLGNENNIATWAATNAPYKKEAWATLLQEIAEWIHEVDPNHPVAVSDGNDNGAMLYYYNQFAPDIDIVAYNTYSVTENFGQMWNNVKVKFDRPVMLGEFGMFAYQNNREDEQLQQEIVLGLLKDIKNNSAEQKVGGNSIGGMVYDFIDRWYLDGSPYGHNSGIENYWLPTQDGLFHEEWYGITSMGNGSDWLMRQKRSVYDGIKNYWTNTIMATSVVQQNNRELVNVFADSNGISVQFSLKKESDVKIELVNTSGIVRKQLQYRKQAGYYSESIPFRGLPDAFYIVRFSTPSACRSVKVLGYR